MINIPNSKFTQPSNPYSFIAYFNDKQKLVEIYLPPVATAPDFISWLTQHKFEAKSDRLYTAKEAEATRKLVTDLIEKAKPNGPYLAKDINNLEDRHVEPQARPRTIKSKLESLLENKIDSAIAKIKEQNLDLAREKDAEIAELKKAIKELEDKLAIATAKLSEYEEFIGEGDAATLVPISPFGGDSKPRVFSPFAPELDIEDNTYLSSAYSGNADEILDPEDYDEEEYNELNSPADLSPLNKSDDLSDLDLSDLKDSQDSDRKKQQKLDLDKALASLEAEEDTSGKNGAGKKK